MWIVVFFSKIELGISIWGFLFFVIMIGVGWWCRVLFLVWWSFWISEGIEIRGEVWGIKGGVRGEGSCVLVEVLELMWLVWFLVCIGFFSEEVLLVCEGEEDFWGRIMKFWWFLMFGNKGFLIVKFWILDLWIVEEDLRGIVLVFLGIGGELVFEEIVNWCWIVVLVCGDLGFIVFFFLEKDDELVFVVKERVG